MNGEKFTDVMNFISIDSLNISIYMCACIYT